MSETNALPQAAIAAVALEGEPPTDRAFEADGVTYRVRLVRAAVASPAIAGVEAAPFLEAYDLTITRLDADGAVVRNAAGEVVIVANTRWTVDEAALTKPGGHSFQAQLDLLVAHHIWKAGLVGTAAVEISQVLADWGTPVSA